MKGRRRLNKKGKAMICKNHSNGGIYFRFEKDDWLGETKQFFAAIKKLSTWVYQPAELDQPEGWWFIGSDSLAGAQRAYYEYIVRPLQQIKADRSANRKQAIS